MENKNSKRIFLVEDDPFYRELVLSHLCDEGYLNVECCRSAEEFSDNLYKNPDIIFLDYNLEDKNGLDILREIKGFNPDIHVVFLSAQNTIQVAVDALRYGALEYIVKDDMALDKINNVLMNISRLDQIIIKHDMKNKTLINTLTVLLAFAVITCTLLIIN